MSSSNVGLLQLLFSEMKHEDEDNLETAKECICGLLRVSMKRERFREFKEVMTQQILLLRADIDGICESDNVPLAEEYQDIFVDFCKLNQNQIIEDESQEILLDLIKLMGVGMKKPEQLLEDRYDDQIRARYQRSFWVDFLIEIQKLGSAEYKL